MTKYILLKWLLYLVFFPVSLCIEILIAGFLVSCFTNKKKLGNIFIISGLILLVLFSTYFVPSFLLQRLEYKYPTLTDSDISNKYSEIRYIVVLGGGIVYSERLPITSQFYPTSLARIAEGMRLYFQLHKNRNYVKLVV